MARIKKITIAEDQAEQLEELMGDYLTEPGPLAYDDVDDYGITSAADLKHLLKELRVPVKLIRTIFSRLENIGGDVSNLQHNGDITRDVIDDISAELKGLDELLGKIFNVQRARKTKKPYSWQVWS